MKTCGIICELNPAHNGHKYIFDKARELTEADYIIAIMSGDFVQRGEPAIFDKHIRTKMALKLGANAVIELPGILATGSAQYFARGAVAILSVLNIDYLVFGSECGDLELLRSQEFNTPNDILGSEYIKAIDYFKSSIIPVAVNRIGTDYNDTASVNDHIASASFIREKINDNIFDNLSNVVPANIYPLFLEALSNDHCLYPNDLSTALFYKLNVEKNMGFHKYFDTYKDLSDKIIKHLHEYKDLTDYSFKLKSKEIAFSHIKRSLLHILLNYTNSDMNQLIDNDYIAYIRLLGFNSKSPQIFSVLNERLDTRYKLITKLSDAKNILNDFSFQLFLKDIAASDLYNYLCTIKNDNIQIQNELSRPLIKS